MMEIRWDDTRRIMGLSFTAKTAAGPNVRKTAVGERFMMKIARVFPLRVGSPTWRSSKKTNCVSCTVQTVFLRITSSTKIIKKGSDFMKTEGKGFGLLFE